MIKSNTDDMQDELRRIEAIQSMCRTRGWKLIKEHFEVVVSAITEKLIIAESGDLTRLQERLKAYREVLKVSEDFTALKEVLVKELEETKLDEAYLRKYALT